MSDTCSNPECGRELPERAKFCPYCGHRVPTEDVRRRAASVRVTPSSVAVAPGASATLSLTVTNLGDIVDHVYARVEPPADAWASVHPSEQGVMPKDNVEMQLELRPPQSADVMAGEHRVVVTLAGEADGGTPLAHGTGIVHVQPVRQLTVRIVPRRDESRYNSARQVELTNTGNAPLMVELAATDPDDALVFGVPPGPVELPFRGELSRRIDVRARRPRLRGRPLERQFSVTAGWQGGGSLSAGAVFMHKSWRLMIAMVVLAILVVAGLVAGAGAM